MIGFRLGVLFALALIAVGRAQTLPELPRTTVDTSFLAREGGEIVVPAGGDLQAALAKAQPGETLMLAPGATYRGNFVLPNKAGSRWIVIRSGSTDGALPPPGTRVGPGDAHAMAKLVADSGSVVSAAAGAHHYRFVGLEMRPSEGVFLYNLIQLGDGEKAIDQVPHDIVFDRCYLHGDPLRGTRRGIAMNSAATAVIDSYLSDFKEADTDAQAIAGWNGPGPFRIENNYLEAATENVMFGGADPTIRDLVPADIVLRRNHFKKPLSWREQSWAPGKSGWSVKNLFELKNARRVLIDGNLFEYSWSSFAVLFTVRNQNGRAPWSTVEDVTFVHNVVRHSGGAINMHGADNEWPSQKTARVLIANNLFEDIDGSKWGGKGRFVQILAGARDVVVDHNTSLQDGAAVFAEGEAFRGFVFRHNLLPHGGGIAGTNHAPGMDTLEYYFPGSVVENNVMWGAAEMERAYPGGNFFPESIAEVGFVNPDLGDYGLSERSRYRRRGTDGENIGADLGTLSTALGAAQSR